MKVKELIEELMKYDLEKDVVVSINVDGEYSYEVDKNIDCVWDYPHALIINLGGKHK